MTDPALAHHTRTVTNGDHMTLDEQIDHIRNDSADNLHYTITHNGISYHLAFSIMGTLKRVNTVGTPDDQHATETAAVIDRLWSEFL